MEIGVSQSIFTQKISKDLWENCHHTLQYGRKILWRFFIFMELELFPYYFLITKTLSQSNDKWKLMYLNQYSPQKSTQALQDHEIHPIQHGIFMWNRFKIYLDVDKIFTPLFFQVFSFVFLILLFCDHQDTESEPCEIEMSIYQPISTHKNISKDILENYIHTL